MTHYVYILEPKREVLFRGSKEDCKTFAAQYNTRFVKGTLNYFKKCAVVAPMPPSMREEK